MMKIEVDEAYAFDMLAIMELKAEYSPTDMNKIIKEEFLKTIRKQLGNELTSDIRASYEYSQLLDANRKAYLLVDRIFADEEFSAHLVHNANMERYQWKRKIQHNFFGQDLNEQKTV